MKAFVKLSQLHLKLFMREPMALFFTFIFPVVLLVVFGAIFGNTPDPDFSPDYGYLDTETPALLVLVIATVALMGIPINQATWREKGILRRFQSTPISPALYLLADVLVYVALTVMGAALLIVVAEVGFDLRFGGSWWRVALGFGLSMLALFGIGYAIATITRTSRLAAATGNILFFPLIFLSGAMFPLELFPQWVQMVGRALPTTFMVGLLRNLWFDAAWSEVLVELGVLGGTAVISLFIAAALWNRSLTLNVAHLRVHTNHQRNQSAASKQRRPLITRGATSNKWLKLYLMHCRLFLREPIAFFFTLLFPVLMLFVFAGIDGNTPQASLGGFGAVDHHMGGYMGIIIASVALINVPIDLAVWREKQILRRFGATAVSIPTVISSMGAMYVTMIALGSVVLVGFGKWFYGVRFIGGLGNSLGLAAAFFLSCAAMMSVGFLIAAFTPTARLAQVVGMVLFFPMIFLSGGTIPHKIMSAGVLSAAHVFPLTHVVTLLKGVWLGWAEPTWFPSLLVLFALLIIAGGGSVRWFKWDSDSSGKLLVFQQKKRQIERSLK